MSLTYRPRLDSRMEDHERFYVLIPIDQEIAGVRSLSVTPLYCNDNVPVGAPVVPFAKILLSPNE
jgi:hypothetical protein